VIHGVAIPAMTAVVTAGAEQSREEASQTPSRAEAIAEERELALAAQGGCMESYEQLVSRFEGQLFHFLLKKTGDHHLSQDLLQTTFVIAYRKLHRFNPKYAFSTWIYTIANRQAINHFRRQRPFDSEDADRVVEEAPDTELIATEQAEELWVQVRKLLSSAQYDALWFFYGEDRNLEQTARVMSRSVGSVKVLLHRARKKLSDDLPSQFKIDKTK
jgi:RNA polymerase sigma-70 factor (ECF subfamily)